MCPGVQEAQIRGHGRPQHQLPPGQVLADGRHAPVPGRPIMNEILQGKGLAEVAEGKVQVTDVKGPLGEGWRHKVEAFATRIPIQG
jgi:hypothetical protein